MKSDELFHINFTLVDVETFTTMISCQNGFHISNGWNNLFVAYEKKKKLSTRSGKENKGFLDNISVSNSYCVINDSSEKRTLI